MARHGLGHSFPDATSRASFRQVWLSAHQPPGSCGWMVANRSRCIFRRPVVPRSSACFGSLCQFGCRQAITRGAVWRAVTHGGGESHSRRGGSFQRCHAGFQIRQAIRHRPIKRGRGRGDRSAQAAFKPLESQTRHGAALRVRSGTDPREEVFRNLDVELSTDPWQGRSRQA